MNIKKPTALPPKNIIDEAKEYVNKLLTNVENHYYHQYEHTIDVFNRTTYLAEKEGLTPEEIEMMQLAAIFHDSGFIVQYDKNEPIGAKLASNYLKSMLYPNEKIQTIERIILATDPEYDDPKDIYEAIIKDADIDNLGREDFFEKGERVKEELETVKRIKIKNPSWHHAMLDLQYKNKFFTKTQQNERNIQKEKNIEKLKSKIEKT